MYNLNTNYSQMVIIIINYILYEELFSGPYRNDRQREAEGWKYF